MMTLRGLGKIVMIAACVSVAGAAMLAPSFLNALNRKRQKVTMRGAVDWGNALHRALSAHAMKRRVVVSSADLADLTRGTSLQVEDGWGRPYRITMHDTSYLVQSAGRDGRFEARLTSREIQRFECDIAYSDGSFVQWPEGL